MSAPTMQRDALISPCGQYRYALGRRWAPGGRRALIIMLNPSTADADQDDPTIRRCIGFAKSWGCAAVTVLNVYAYRATDPKVLWRAADPIGPENDITITSHAMAHAGAPLVAAWGAHARPGRVAAVLTLPGMERLAALGFTKGGQPRHPLYLSAAAELRPYREATDGT